MGPLVLGIDTSAYTTSAALLTVRGGLVSERRQLLRVELGQRGLRQADAVYQHVRSLPAVIESLFAGTQHKCLAAVAVSSTPRPIDGSFMPVFLVGMGAGRAIAAAQGLYCGEISHQEGHIWAALWSLPQATELGRNETLLAVHLSGGTTEAVLMHGLGLEHQSRPGLELVAASSDISAGQFVDRVGTGLGLPFPAGPHLEMLAARGEAGSVQLPSAVHDLDISFSGPESAAARLISIGASPADVALATLECLADSVAAWLLAVVRQTGVSDILVAGGVAANQKLRARLAECLGAAGCQLAFGAPSLSSDNAVGVASWAAARLSGVPVLALPDRLGEEGR